MGGERGALGEGFGVAAFGVGEEPAGCDFDVVHFYFILLALFLWIVLLRCVQLRWGR